MYVRALQRIHDLLAVFQRGLAADFRVRASAQALGDVGAQLQLQLGAAVLDRLRVGVGGDELHPVHAAVDHVRDRVAARSEEHTSELQSLMRISYAVFCLKKKTTQYRKSTH